MKKNIPKSKEKTIVDQLEVEYPTIATEFKKIQQQQYELFAQKMLSYGLDNISMGSKLETDEEKKLSLTAVWIRCSDKMNRLKNLILFNKSNTVKNESVVDTYQDLVNYNIIAQLVIENKWKK